MKQSKANDFSKIQGRFRTRLSLSSANVDEVIQSRLLAKREEVKSDLQEVFRQKGDILKNQLTFTNCGMTFKNVKDGEDFVQNYPFVPYQFQLVQKIFEAIRRAGATGLHLSRGERSILDAFQSAGKQVALEEVGILVPLYRFYPSIESFLDTVVKKTIDQAKDNPSLEHPFDIRLLQVLFLIRYVEEVKGNVDNLVTLCVTEIDADRLALRRKIEGSLQRLEKETLINRSGDVCFFLTNEERDINREIKNVELSSGEEAKLLGELIYNDVLKEQRKHRHPENKMDFAFNRFCDLVPVGNRLDGVLQLSVITPLNDEYGLYDNAKCLLDSSTEGGSILVRLGNDATLGRELRTYLQTEKYVRHKNDGTLPESAKRILRDLSGNNQDRRDRLVKFLGDMFAGADYYAAGQPLKLKASTSLAALDESLAYLVKNTFNKMGYLKRLSQEPLKEIQAVLRSNDIAQQTLILETDEGNKQAIDEVRNYVGLMSSNNKQIVLQDMIDKRYSLRPYGWPEDEVVMLIARLMVLGEISLMTEGALVPLNKAYDAITIPAKRRKVVILKRQTTDPKAIQDARTLGKELFHEMGPDGEDALFAFLQNKLKSWQSSLISYKPLAETGDYPGRDQIADGLLAVKKLLASDNSYKFIQQLTEQKNELLDYADHFTNLEQFYEHQKPTWERLRKAYDRFQRNRLELERDAKAGVALKRMQQILNASSSYSLIKETEGLITTVSAVNNALVAAARQQALAKIDGHLVTVTRDIEAAKEDSGLRATCMKPLEGLKGAVLSEESLAHITQIEAEALKEFDIATSRIEESVRRAIEQSKEKEEQPKPALKKKRVVEPAKLVTSSYLETQADVEAFLKTLRSELEQALTKDERIEIR